ncbi:MAG: hypothetical protein COB45_11015 [Gammaproteobacteria bacterium]|nr:MAG: hypothetical protein COB45_11015 [Gammaproteobacteria bacterium]PHR81242.1 MAG: hypothetical protein COA59_16395 [Colwellia sp.]
MKNKNISLVKVTFAVIAMALASSLVSAQDVIPKNIPAIEAPTSKNIQFEQLDLDKNGSLSLVETEGDKLIHDAFTKIDSNNDATISKIELNEFIKQ